MNRKTKLHTVKHDCFNQKTCSTTLKWILTSAWKSYTRAFVVAYMKISLYPAIMRASVMLLQNINLRCFCAHWSNNKTIREKKNSRNFENQNICRLFNVFIFTPDHFPFARDITLAEWLKISKKKKMHS